MNVEPRSPRILALSAYLPAQTVTNQEMEARIRYQGEPLPTGMLQRLFGLSERRFADAAQQTSDLAAQAARPILAAHPEPIDLLLFAAASSDVLEPATAAILQAKLGLPCPAFDVKNACNSFLSALETAYAYVQSGMARRVLICSGEKISEVIRYQTSTETDLELALAGYTLGDAGAAALVGAGDGHLKIQGHFHTQGDLWHLCTIKSGGSMAPRDPEQSYFSAHGAAMLHDLRVRALPFLAGQWQASGIHPSDIDLLVVHQISAQTTQLVAAGLGIPAEKCFTTFPYTGNTAATSLPLALVAAQRQGRLRPGMRVAVVGLAAGISLALQVWDWGSAPAYGCNLPEHSANA